MKYVQPTVNANSFTCPNCGVLSKQNWFYKDFNLGTTHVNEIKTSFCHNCEDYTVWIYGKMFYPEIGNAPFPNREMPEPVKKLYLEAASISNKSPRGAAALLRLSIQILCKELDESGKNINNDIKKLVAKGLPLIVQQALDVVRVTGNDAVHPGLIDTDDISVVNKLFGLLNVIVEYMIALPNEVSGIYADLPPNKIKEIQNRDKNNSSTS